MASRSLPPKTFRSPSKEEGDSSLHSHSYHGDYSAALMLVLANEDINARNNIGETPLHHATSQGHLEIMMLLLDASAEVNARDKESLTPLHQALIHGNRNATELLLSYGARLYNEDAVSDTMSPVDFSDHVPVCNDLLKEAQGRVWPLQHFCRLAIRKYMGVGRRRRIKELPLPRHVISYLISLPISCSDRLHANWERTRSTKCKLVKERLESHRPKRGGATNVGVLQVLKGFSDS